MALPVAAAANRVALLGPAPWPHVYFGNEACEDALPPLEEVERVAAEAAELTLVTPFMTRRGLAWLEQACGRVAVRRPGRPAEVLVNDWGALRQVAADPSLVPVAGRFLARTAVDLLQGRLCLCDAGMLAWLRSEYRLTRFEVSAHRHRFAGSDFAGRTDCHLSLHYPYQCLTLSRSCVLRYMGVPQQTRMDTVPCDRGRCSRTYRLTYPGFVEDELLLRGTAVFIEHPRPPHTDEQLLALGIDRLVIAAEPPL